MQNILFLAVAVLSIWYFAVLVKYDLYKREPLWARGVAVLLGASLFTGGFFLSAWLCQVLPGGVGCGWRGVIVPAVCSSVCEDGAKVAGVLVIAFLCRGAFGADPFDGIVYGACVGVGAAVSEFAVTVLVTNVRGDAWAQLVCSSLGHPVLTGVGAAGIGLIGCRVRWAWIVVAGVSTWVVGWAIHWG